jgi:hypothetical protein
MEKIKKQVTSTYKTTKTIAENLEHLVQSVALVIVVGLGVYAIRSVELNKVVHIVCFAALVIIGFRASYEFIKFFDFKRK